MPSNYKNTVPRIEREILFIFTMICLLLRLSSECHSMRARTWFLVSAIFPGPREGLAGSGCSILGKRANEWMTQSLVPADPALPLHTWSEQRTGKELHKPKTLSLSGGFYNVIVPASKPGRCPWKSLFLSLDLFLQLQNEVREKHILGSSYHSTISRCRKSVTEISSI